MMALTANVYAQKLNKDTVAKYSDKAEQIKLFNKVAADIHLNGAQTEKFNAISTDFSGKAFAIVQNSGYTQCDKVSMLKQTLIDYRTQIREILTAGQIKLLREEVEKYKFGRRFVSFKG